MKILLEGGLSHPYMSFISNLSPLQKKVALAALFIFSSMLLIHCAYRCCFQARKIDPKKTNGAAATEKDVPRAGLNPQYVEEWKEQPGKIVFKDVSQPAKQVPHLALQVSSLKQRENRPFQGNLLGISISNWVVERLSLAWLFKRDGDNEVLFHALRKKAVVKTAPQKHLLALTERPNKKSIRERLEKNRKFAKAQQDAEEPQGFELQEGEIPKFLLVTEQRPYLTKLKPLHGITRVIKGKHVGIASCEGPRTKMEDTDLTTSITFEINGKSHNAYLFAVFDGHGGSHVSIYLKGSLAQFLIEELENQNSLTDEGIFEAFKVSFIKLNDTINANCGSTATVLFILNKKIWVANTGDSRTILIKPDGTPVQASEDAKLDIERYQKKIEKLGGKIALGAGLMLRVNGVLAMARAFGNKHLVGTRGQVCILPNPKITDYSLQEYEGGYAVLACDGLYDVATTNEVGAMIKKMNEIGDTPEEMAKRLVWSAILDGSSDNVSVMVIKL